MKRATVLDEGGGSSAVVTSGMRLPPEQRFDWPTVTDSLARSAPVWEPGTRWEYHGPTFGYLVGEIVRRIDGRPLDVFFREEIAEPLGADVAIAIGPEDDHRCAEAVGDEGMGAVPLVGDPWMADGRFRWVNVNSRVWHGAADGASTGLGSADGLARVYAALANGGELDGVRLLRPETIAAAAEEQPLARADGTVDEFGLGYALLSKANPEAPVGSFGHPGAGGSLGLADPARRLSFGYVMNQMGSNGAAHLLRALSRSVRT
jgi:CubicO group peptidase (beta-lactamase class C family)